MQTTFNTNIQAYQLFHRRQSSRVLRIESKLDFHVGGAHDHRCERRCEPAESAEATDRRRNKSLLQMFA